MNIFIVCVPDGKSIYEHEPSPVLHKFYLDRDKAISEMNSLKSQNINACVLKRKLELE